MVPEGVPTWNPNSASAQTKQRGDPCSFFGFVEDVYTVNVVYISINIHDKPHSHPLYIKISVLELCIMPMYMYLMCCF